MTKQYWWIIITYIITLFAAIFIGPLLLTILPISKSEAFTYATVMSFVIGLTIILLLTRTPPKMELFRNEDKSSLIQIILWSIIGVFMAYTAQLLAVSIEVYVFGIKVGSENTGMIMDITRATPFFIIIPTLIGPILEEIVFRKVIFGTLYKRTNFFIAALLSAIVFGIVHGELSHILIYASMGFVFAFLYVKTKRIIVPIIVHISMNTITILAQYSLTPEDIERMQRELEQLQTFIGG